MTHIPFVASVPLPSRMEWIRDAETFIVDTARALSVASASDPLFTLAVHEALTNAVRHGNRHLPSAAIACEVELAGDWFKVRIFDDGPGFSLSSVRPLQLDPNRLETLSEDGFGLPIIQSVFPAVRTISRDGRFGIELATIARSAAAAP